MHSVKVSSTESTGICTNVDYIIGTLHAEVVGCNAKFLSSCSVINMLCNSLNRNGLSLLSPVAQHVLVKLVFQLTKMSGIFSFAYACVFVMEVPT